MKKNTRLISLFALFLLLSSCATRKQMIYLQDMDETVDYPVTQKYEMKIQRDDRLQITVSSKDPELSLAFNLPGVSGYRITNEGSVDVNSSTSSSKAQCYVVDVNGDIEFPILGRLHVEGLTRSQLTAMIRDQLEQRELLKNPLVQADILNFSFSVLGEVGSVGRYTIDGDRITILEAIAMAGDLKTTSRIDRVAVFREFGGHRRVMHLDLRSKDIFLSPAYYLQQNDIVYVEPNGQQAEEQSSRRLRNWMYGISSATTILSLILLFKKL